MRRVVGRGRGRGRGRGGRRGRGPRRNPPSRRTGRPAASGRTWGGKTPGLTSTSAPLATETRVRAGRSERTRPRTGRRRGRVRGQPRPSPPPRGRSWPGMTLQRRPPGSSACAQAPQGMHTTRWRPGRSSRRRRATVWSRRPTSPTPAPRVTPEQRAPACAAWPRLAANPPPNRKVPGGGAAAAVAGERKLRGRPGRLGGCSNERAGE